MHKFPNAKQGTTFNGRNFTITANYSLVGASIIMDFKYTENSPIVFSFKTSDNTIEVISAGSYKMKSRFLHYTERTYFTYLKIILLNGDVKELGKISWTIE
jgi:hypothetical protein